MTMNKVAVVTGASAGVGRAVAIAFARDGFDLGLLARGAEGLESLREEIEQIGGRALAIVTDVSDAAAIDRAAAQIERDLGPIDVWVNNAMVTVYASSVDIEPAEWEQVTRVTYLGQVFGALAALRFMRRRNRGAIVFIGSALAYRSIPFQAPYCAAKSAVRGFVDSLRSELLWENSAIRLSMVQLPAVNTPQFDWARSKFSRKVAPVPPIFQPETVAAAVLKAAHEGPREYWLGFSAVKAIVAQMIAPSLADRILAKAGKGNETTNEPADKGRPDNLFEAGVGDPGAHGRFDAKSRGYAVPYNPTMLRALTGASLALIGGALAYGASRSRLKRQADGMLGSVRSDIPRDL